MITRRQLILLMGTLPFLLLAIGCVRMSEKPVKISVHTWPGYETLFLARSEGWLDNSKVSLIEAGSASTSIELLRAGKVDGAALTLDEVFRARAEGIPLTVIMIFDISAGADMVVVRPEILRLADLKGRTIGYEPQAVGALMLSQLLKAAGLEPTNVKLVQLTIDQHLTAWQERRVDACITYMPVARQLQALGAVNLFDSRRLPDMISDVLVVRRDVLDRQHASAIQHLVESHFTALRHLLQNPQDAAYRMARHMRLPAHEVLLAFKGLILPNAANNRRLLAGPAPQLLTPAQHLSAIMVEQGLLRRDDSLAELISADYLPNNPEADR